MKNLILDLSIPYGITPEKYQGHQNASASNEKKDRYLAALSQELSTYEDALSDYQIGAVRLSGGSATVMSPDLLGQLLKQVRRSLPLAPQAQISFDALPNTIGTPSLTGIAPGRPTRAELQMHSAHDNELATLGCAFQMQHTQNALLFFQKFHLNNISLTIHLGIPGQTLDSWRSTLRACTISSVDHVRIEPCLPSPEELTSGVSFPEPELQRAMYETACDTLSEQGLLQYGTGLFCHPHFEDRYELLRCDGASLLGLGCGAFSLLDDFLTRNTTRDSRYLQHAQDAEARIVEVLRLTPDYWMRRYVYGRLQLTAGLREEAFAERFGVAIPPALAEELSLRIQDGLLTHENGVYRPTREGLYALLPALTQF